MLTVTAYSTADGQLFSSEKQATEHENDLIGQELDLLFDVFKLKSGNQAIGHQSIYHACLHAIRNKQQLMTVCAEIVRIIGHEGIDCDD